MKKNFRGLLLFGFLLCPALCSVMACAKRPVDLSDQTAVSGRGQEPKLPNQEVPLKAPPMESPEASERPLAYERTGSGNTAALDAFELARYQYCGSDRDCVVAINGCCDCANGGVEVAVNNDRLKAFRERFDCLHMTCGMVPPNPPCASGVVSCISHKCKYFPRGSIK